MLVQRDYGDRTNRKHARLKYTVDDHGIDWFRNEVETRYGTVCMYMRTGLNRRSGDAKWSPKPTIAGSGIGRPGTWLPKASWAERGRNTSFHESALPEPLLDKAH